jgi:hypothetical protein
MTDFSRAELIIETDPFSGTEIARFANPGEFEAASQAALMATANEPDPLAQFSADDITELFRKASRDEDTRRAEVIEAAQIKEASEQWIEENPAYAATPENGAAMLRRLQLMNADATNPADYTRAFQSLVEDGLVKPDVEAHNEFQRDVRAARRTHRVGALSAKRGYAPAPVSETVDYSKLTTKELEERALQYLYTTENHGY